MPAKTVDLNNPLTAQQLANLNRQAYALTQLDQAIDRATAAGLDTTQHQLAQADLRAKVANLLRVYSVQQFS